MGLILDLPQARPTIAPPARPTNARFWADYRLEQLRAIQDKIATVIEAKARNLDLETEASTEAVPAPAPTAKNETLGGILSPSQANLFLNCSAKGGSSMARACPIRAVETPAAGPPFTRPWNAGSGSSSLALRPQLTTCAKSTTMCGTPRLTKRRLPRTTTWTS